MSKFIGFPLSILLLWFFSSLVSLLWSLVRFTLACCYYVISLSILLRNNYNLLALVRTLRRDIAQYNKEDEEIDETLEETGWKLVHGDIFRPPTKSTILCALVGSGIQIGMMGLITIIVAMFGMLSPSARGSLITGNITSQVPSY